MILSGAFFFVWSLPAVFCTSTRTSVEESPDPLNGIDLPIPTTGGTTLYVLDNAGVFHRSSPPEISEEGREVVYSVLKSGVLVPETGQYAVEYKINSRGDLVPTTNNSCIYKSEKPAFYITSSDAKLIPVDIYYSGDEIHYVYGRNKLILTEKIGQHVKHSSQLKKIEPRVSKHLTTTKSPVLPDKSCNGDVSLFLLKSNGEFARNPPDEYIPKGMKIRYHLEDSGMLTPLHSETGLPLTYVTDTNGNLKPCDSNSHTFATLEQTCKSFLLGEGGRLAPVTEVMDVNKSIQYFYDGQLVHSSDQFKEVYSNTSMLVLAEKDPGNDTQVEEESGGPKFVCPPKRIVKRDTKDLKDESSESVERPPITTVPNPHCRFAYDDKGKRILLEPLITSSGNVALYKLTCKGHLKRLDKYKEPECGFEVKFRLIDNLILVPSSQDPTKLVLRYTLQENGNLIPCPKQQYSLKKAPASLVYFVLAKNKELLPVRLNILKSNHIQLYFQDCLIYTICPEFSKNLEVFTTIYVPLYAYVCSRLVLGYTDYITKPMNGSTWKNPSKDIEHCDFPLKNLYLVCPNKQKIKIVPSLNKRGVPIIFEMDCNGVCHKSPKDENKNIALKSYKLLKEGILVQTNETNCYIYMIDKSGNMLPYCYPESKLRAPFGLTVKYVMCKEGVLLPILVEAVDGCIQFSFEEAIIYKKFLYSIDQVLEIEKVRKESGQEVTAEKQEDEIAYFVDKNGSCAYYEKVGNYLKRKPPQKVEPYLLHTTGYFKILSDGVLKSTDYPDPTCENLHVMIECNGDLQIMPNNKKKLNSTCYLLACSGDLIPVQILKRERYIKFYRNGKRVYKQMLNNDKNGEGKSDGLIGSDPLGVYKDPEPKKTSDKDPHYIPIPIGSCKLPNKGLCPPNEYEKCEHIRKTIQSLMSHEGSSSNVELEMSDKIMKEIYDLAHRCAKLKSRNRLTRSVRKYSLDEDC